MLNHGAADIVLAFGVWSLESGVWISEAGSRVDTVHVAHAAHTAMVAWYTPMMGCVCPAQLPAGPECHVLTAPIRGRVWSVHTLTFQMSSWSWGFLRLRLRHGPN